MHFHGPIQAGGRSGARRRNTFLLLSGLLFGVTPISVVTAQSMQAEKPAIGGRYARSVADASQRFRIPAHWIATVLGAESAGDPRTVSEAGAMGLMQVMPDTWVELSARHRLGDDPFDVGDNIMAGAAYLREMFDRYGNVSAMLAAYNAGPGRYDEYRATGRPLPAETRAYVTALAPLLGGEPLSNDASPAPSIPADWRDAPLFIVSVDSVTSAAFVQQGSAVGADPASTPYPGHGADGAPDDSLFVPRSSAGDRL